MIIRINLHPAKKPKTKSNPGTIFLLFGILIAAGILGAFWVVGENIKADERKVKGEIQKVEASMSEIKSRISDLTSIKQKIDELNNRQLILARLTSIRQGPQFVLNEFSHIMTNPRDVIARKEATEQGWLLAWEPENVIIETFKDVGNSQIEITGTARTMDDVQEFWTRMKTSKQLRNIRLLEISDKKDSISGDTVQDFTFRLDANFNYQTREGRELVDKLLSDDSSFDEPENAESQPAPKQ
ncbi:MAG: PilN domain-containing protein [Proteobacteria bacterium]|nr:PilN domain-containing protein [Pseudomonadota bacterium]